MAGIGGALAPGYLLDVLATLTTEQRVDFMATLTPEEQRVIEAEFGGNDIVLPGSPLEQAQVIDPLFRTRPHLQYLSDRIRQAVRDVEGGKSRRLIVEMPPRSGKTTLSTLVSPAWMLSCHPDWPIALTSHDGGLATSWGRTIRRWVEEGKLPGITIRRDAGAASSWETTADGKLLSLSLRESFTGRGAKVLIIDDPHKDAIDAHSPVIRQNVWDWWLSVALNRLEPPSLVIVTMTRWHQDDFVGRLLSPDYEGDPADWERIRLPAIAEEDDPIRAEGQPLISPLIEESMAEALVRWQDTRKSVGEYVWASMLQQRPAPAKGAIFDAGWWRYWTTDPGKATEDGRIVHLDPVALTGGRWLDSWDATFKGTDSSDFVVGQRWVQVAADRFLIGTVRDRLSFTQTIERMQAWALPGSVGGTGVHVHERLIEEAANGAAIIDTLRKTIPGLKAIRAVIGKEARARAVTPEVESGNVYLPHPSDPGNGWVGELTSELRNFPHDAHDDQVDALTQALLALRTPAGGHISIPGARVPTINRDVAAAARSMPSRTRRR